MRLTARNQLPGTITAIEIGTVMAMVTLELPGGQQVTAAVTRAAVEELGLTVGAPATAVIKSTEVIIGVD
jgi:molybdate transport system regulatory protein